MLGFVCFVIREGLLGITEVVGVSQLGCGGPEDKLQSRRREGEGRWGRLRGGKHGASEGGGPVLTFPLRSVKELNRMESAQDLR